MAMDRTRALRAENLERVFPGVFEDLIVLPIHGDKLPVLNQFFPCYWVEDSARNALKGIEAGHEVFLMDCEHNRHVNHANVTRVQDWTDIVNRLENGS
jgi:uncharacterized HAD superfamily protein